MRIRDLPLLFVAPLLLVSCASLNNRVENVATPQRCEDALAGVSTLNDLIKVLIAHGIRAEELQGVATLLAEGQVTIAEVCAYAASQTAPTPPPSTNTL